MDIPQVQGEGLCKVPFGVWGCQSGYPDPSQSKPTRIKADPHTSEPTHTRDRPTHTHQNLPTRVRTLSISSTPHVSIHARQHPPMSQTSAHTRVNLPTCTSPPEPAHLYQPRRPAPAPPTCTGPAHLHQPRPPVPASSTCTFCFMFPSFCLPRPPAPSFLGRRSPRRP